MIRVLIFLTLTLGLIGSCESQKKEGNAVVAITNDSISCAADSANMLNPNGETELALLMRKIDADLMAQKMSMKAGIVPKVDFDHSSILTAQPTKKEIKGDPVFASYGETYLSAVKAMKEAPLDSMVSMHNKIVYSCINCHQSYCTGPIDRIRKLKVNPKNISL